MKENICLTCKIFFRYNPALQKGKFCSYKCYWKSKKDIYPVHTGTIRRGKMYCMDCNKQLSHLISKTKRCIKCHLKNMLKSRTLPDRHGKNNPFFGKTHSEITRKKISLNNIGKTIGEKNHNWKGGISKNRHKGSQYNLWRKEVFERDNYTCQKCWTSKNYLNAHHLKSWANYPLLRFNIDNGITVCIPCHALLDPRNARLIYAQRKEVAYNSDSP